MSKKSIKLQLTRNFTISIAVIFVFIFCSTFIMVKKDVQSVKESSIQKMVDQSIESITQKIDGMFSTAYTIAADPEVYTTATGFEEKRDRLIEYQNSRGANSIGYITADGYLTSTDGFENDISDRDYFKNLMQGGKYISNPSWNTATESQIIFIGVPIYENNSIVACMTLTFGSDYLSQYVSNINYIGKGDAYMLASYGNVIASSNIDDVLNKYNVIELAKEDSSLEKAAEVHQEILDSQELQGIKHLDGNILFYQKMPDLNDWIMIYRIPEADFNKEVNSLIGIFALSGIIGLALVLTISLLVGSRLGNRLLKLKSNLETVSEGDFTVALDEKELQATDEIGIIYQSTQNTIKAIEHTLVTMKEITENLSRESTTLDHTSQQLLLGTDSVTNSMGEIQKGNSEQANEIENIYHEMEKFNTNVENVDTNISGVVVTSSDATSKLKKGNTDISALQDSFGEFHENFSHFRTIIHDMTESLSSINMITSTISDIADQTNLLSLNASIEAARAGEVGKGFGVVAMEIAKLADQSSSSIESINESVGSIISIGENLIQSTDSMGNQIDQQSDIIQNTLASFEEITRYMEEMLPQIQEISKISKENLSTSKIIGDSIQNVTAISEELLATTTEVNNTTADFQSSSHHVSDSSEQILNLSNVLSNLSTQFKVNEK